MTFHADRWSAIASGAVSAHHAIIPTFGTKALSELGLIERGVYELVARRCRLVTPRQQDDSDTTAKSRQCLAVAKARSAAGSVRQRAKACSRQRIMKNHAVVSTNRRSSRPSDGPGVASMNLQQLPAVLTSREAANASDVREVDAQVQHKQPAEMPAPPAGGEPSCRSS